MEETKFNDTTSIQKNDPAFPADHFDFEVLRTEGLTHIGELSGDIWTDHNVHDPGVSILELLCYALIDIGYRTKLPITDILALDTNSGQSEDNFFTPAQILTCNPTTILDYRKLLMDVKGVRHAWLEVSDDCTLYLDCSAPGEDRERNLTCEPQGIPGTPGITITSQESPDCPVILNGLYNVYIELDRDNAFCLEKEGSTFDETTVIKEVKEQLYEHRNLCEDFVNLNVLCEQEIGICADIEIAEDADPEAVHIKILQEVNRFLTPEINYYTLQELLRKGKPIEEIFEGKPMTKESFGFIDTEELLKAKRIKEVHLSDIYKLILEIEEVRSVHDLSMSGWINGEKKLDSSQQVDRNWSNDWICVEEEEDCEGWVLKIVENYVPRLCLNRSCLNIKKGEIYLKSDLDRIEMLLRQALSDVQKVRYDSDKYLDIPIPKGNYRPGLGEYYSIQNEMPRVYGIGEGGLPSDAPDKRKAQAYQLKGYLLFYDQLLSGYLSQLSHVRDLFSFTPDSQRPAAVQHSYFSQPLESVPAIEKLIQFHGDTASTLLTEGTTLAILIKKDNDLDLQLEVLRDGFIDFSLDYKTYWYDATFKRNIAIEQFQREFRQGEMTIEILQEMKGFFFIAYTNLSNAILLSRHQYCTYQEAKSASEILTILGSQASIYHPVNEYGAGQFSFEMVYKKMDYLALVQDLVEDKEAYHKRREKFLDHLMARFAEDFTAYSILLFNESVDLEKRVEQKANFLSNYPTISRNRGRAFNYCEPVWGTENISGLERRVAAITGFGNETKGQLCNFEIYTYGDEKVIQILSPDGIVIFRGSEIYETVEAAQKALDALCQALTDPANYQNCKTLPDGSYSFSVTYSSGHAHYGRSFKSKEACEGERTMVMNWFIVDPLKDNVFVSRKVHQLELKDAAGVSVLTSKKEYNSPAAAKNDALEFSKLINTGKEKNTLKVNLVPALRAENNFVNFEPLKDNFTLSEPFYRWNIRNEKGETVLIGNSRLNSKNVAIADFLSVISGDATSMLVNEKEENGAMLLELSREDYAIAKCAFSNNETREAAKIFLNKNLAAFSSQLIEKVDKAYKWQIQSSSGEPLLRSNLIYADRRRAEHDCLELRDYVGEKENFTIQPINEKECCIQIYFKDKSLRASSEKLENKPEQIDQFIEAVRTAISNKKNIKYLKQSEAYSYNVPGETPDATPLFTSYNLYEGRSKALLALQGMLENSAKYKTFNTGDQANLNYSFYLQDENKEFIAYHATTYTSAEERTKTKSKILATLNDYILPIGLEEEYNYSIVDNDLSILTSEAFFPNPAAAEQDFYTTFQKTDNLRNYRFIEKKGKYIAELKENNTVLATSPKLIDNKKRIEEAIKTFGISIAQNCFEIAENVYPKEWKFNFLWIKENQNLQHAFVSDQKYRSVEAARNAYAGFSKNITSAKAKAQSSGTAELQSLRLSTKNNGEELSATALVSERAMPELRKTFEAVKAFRENKALTKSIIDNPAGGDANSKSVFRILKDDPIAYFPCECFDIIPGDDVPGTTPNPSSVNTLKEETIKKLCEKAAEGYQYLEICMAGDICIEIDEKFHYIIKDKKSGLIYMISFEAYATADLAKQAFLENYLEIIDLASDDKNYIVTGDEIILAETTRNEMGEVVLDENGNPKIKNNPIACIQLSAWNLFSDSAEDFAYWFCTFPIRRVTKEKDPDSDCKTEDQFEYCFQLICYPPPVNDDPVVIEIETAVITNHVLEEDCKADWKSSKNYETPEEAAAAFKHFLYLLEFKGSFKCKEIYNPDTGECCEQICLVEILVESSKRYPTNPNSPALGAWGGLDHFLKIACDQDAFNPEMTRDCCFTFKVAEKNFRLAQHPFYYDKIEERNEAIEQLIEHCSSIQKTNLEIDTEVTNDSRFVALIRDENSSLILRGVKTFAGQSNAENHAFDLLTYAIDKRFYGIDDTGAICLLDKALLSPEINKGNPETNAHIIARFENQPMTTNINELVSWALHYPFYKENDRYRFRIYCDGFQYPKPVNPGIPDPCKEDEQGEGAIIMETGAFVWDSFCDYETLAEALIDLDRYCEILQLHLETAGSTFTHTLRNHFQPTGENNCGELGIEFVDPDKILAFHPQCYDRRVELDWAMKRAIDCINVEGMHLIEHILLRPVKGPNEPCECLLAIDPDCHCKLELPALDDEDCADEGTTSSTNCDGKYIPGSDPYSFIATVILPCWTRRFHTESYREAFKAMTRKETPAHIALQFLWITPEEMCKFEKAYTSWLKMMQGEHSCDGGDELCKLVNCLSSLENCETEPGQSNEPDCVCEDPDITVDVESGQEIVFSNKFDRYLSYLTAPEKSALKHVDKLEDFFKGQGSFGTLNKEISFDFLSKRNILQTPFIARAKPDLAEEVKTPMVKEEEKPVVKVVKASPPKTPEKEKPKKATPKKPVAKKASTKPKKETAKSKKTKIAPVKKAAPKKETPKAKTTLSRAEIAKNIRLREASYLANIESGADSYLKKTKSYKRTEFFLSSGGDWKEWLELMDHIIRYSLGKKGGADDEKYLMLLRNASWYCLDQLLISQPDKMQQEKLLKERFAVLQKHGMNLNALMKDWNGENLADWLNATVLKQYLGLVN